MISDFFGGLQPFPPAGASEWLPSVDIKEDDKRVTVKAELPGVKREDVTVEVTADSLTLRGEKREEKEESKNSFWRRETSYGSFVRKIGLPSRVEADGAEAQMKNGVLKIVMPKTTTSKTMTVKIG